MTALEFKILRIAPQREFLEQSLVEVFRAGGDGGMTYFGQIYPENIKYFEAMGWRVDPYQPCAESGWLPVNRFTNIAEVDEDELEFALVEFEENQLREEGKRFEINLDLDLQGMETEEDLLTYLQDYGILEKLKKGLEKEFDFEEDSEEELAIDQKNKKNYS